MACKLTGTEEMWSNISKPRRGKKYLSALNFIKKYYLFVPSLRPASVWSSNTPLSLSSERLRTPL